MVWHVKKTYEDNDKIIINYSYEKNTTCDGVLLYDKSNYNLSIEKLSLGADEFTTKWLFTKIYYLLNTKGLTEQKRRVAIG